MRADPHEVTDEYTDSPAGVLVRLQFTESCGWFVAGTSITVLFGETTGRCPGPAASPPSLSRDGEGVQWARAALDELDVVARLTVVRVFRELEGGVLASSPRAIALTKRRLPGLKYVDRSTAADEVALAVTGSKVAIAVQGQSGTCYLLDADVTANTVIRYGTATGDCTLARVEAATATTVWPNPTG
jgi:hypothetical protein